MGRKGSIIMMIALGLLSCSSHAFVRQPITPSSRPASPVRPLRTSIPSLYIRSKPFYRRQPPHQPILQPVVLMKSANLLSTIGLSPSGAPTTALIVNSALAAFGIAVKQKWLTSSGLFHAWILGLTLWSTLSWRGWTLCVIYLIFGSLVTKVRQREKEVSKH